MNKSHKKNKIIVLAIIAILAAIPFAMGKYFEFNSPGPYDSGAYVYSAKHILDGAKIGVDEIPSAQPATLLVNILGVWLCGFNEIGPKIIQMILQITALLMMFIAIRKLFGTFPAAVAVTIASFYLSAPLIAKFGNVKEQYMIAFMTIAVSCFILRQLKGRFYWAILSGAFLAWAPLFKQTGLSAIIAVALFTILQPILKHKTLKQTTDDILLLLTGAALSLTPVYLWLALSKAPTTYWPYAFLWKILMPNTTASTANSYITNARKLSSFSQQYSTVMRYYSLLICPIALAIAAIITRLYKILTALICKLKPNQKTSYDHFVLLFSTWWLCDMAFVWISPRSYEQYYLPLNASAAMLTAYLIAVYKDAYINSILHKPKWVLVGFAGLVCIIAMSWHIFFGIKTSPHTHNAYPQRSRGYIQKFQEISNRNKRHAKGHWETTAEYIRTSSQPSDKIYVWGWVPGIYVKAQRLSSAPKAFTSEMHVKSPQTLSKMINDLLTSFKKEMPRFIVDTHKRHFPWNRPPLELWPQTKTGFLPANKQAIKKYSDSYKKLLTQRISPDESARYQAMTPFREFIMQNYTIAQKFGPHILFKLKNKK